MDMAPLTFHQFTYILPYQRKILKWTLIQTQRGYIIKICHIYFILLKFEAYKLIREYISVYNKTSLMYNL